MDQKIKTKHCPYCGEEIREEAIVCRYCNRPLPGYEDQVPPSVSSQSNDSRFPRWIIIGALVIGALVILSGLAWYFRDNLGLSALQPCEVQSKQFVTEVESLMDDWDDANVVASSTSRIALGPAVANLQEIRRKATDIETPDCAEPAHEALLQYMDSVIDSYLAFMSDEPTDKVEKHMEESQKNMDIFLMEFMKLKFGEGTPTE